MNFSFRPCGDFRVSYDADKTIFPTRWSLYFILGGIAVLLLSPLYLGSYGVTLLIQIGYMGIGALGLNILTGFTGQISLGHAAFFGLGAFGSTYFSNKYGVPVLFAIPLAGLLAALVGMTFGLPAARIKGLYLAIATLAAQYVLEDFFARAEWFTGGVAGAHAKPVTIFGYALDTEQKYFYFVLAWVIALYVYATNLMRSRDGRAFVAIRDHDISAEIMGINLSRYRILSFGISSFYAGIAGALMGHYLSFVSTESINILLSIQFIGMIIIGGLGSVMGSMLGAIFMVLLPEVLEGVVVLLKNAALITSPNILNGLNFMREAMIGLIIVLFLMFEPDGLIHRWQLVKAYWKLYPFPH
ncbi:MAG: branched-chain amino acid transporter permease [Herminiimonas sp.]|jgi:branched-chain amino acid transport system permease protein|nr:branched-chain amino acid transporter permease [Herminiimonas sp.]